MRQLRLGALVTGQSREQLDALRPQSDNDTLFTRLCNGDGVRISKKAALSFSGPAVPRAAAPVNP